MCSYYVWVIDVTDWNKLFVGDYTRGWENVVVLIMFRDETPRRRQGIWNVPKTVCSPVSLPLSCAGSFGVLKCILIVAEGAIKEMGQRARVVLEQSTKRKGWTTLLYNRFDNAMVDGTFFNFIGPQNGSSSASQQQSTVYWNQNMFWFASQRLLRPHGRGEMTKVKT